MRERGKQTKASAMLFGATGWLFADLLLALAMVFLIASPSGEFAPPNGAGTPQPACTATPVPVPALDPHDIPGFIVNIDPGGIQHPHSSAVNDAKRQVRKHITTYLNDNKLTGSHAGLVILFGGAPTVNQNQDALTNDKAFYKNVLLSLGNDSDHFVFTGNVALKSLATFGASENEMTVDVFLFTPPVETVYSGTCRLQQPGVPTPAGDVNHWV